MPNVLQDLQGVQHADCLQLPKVASNGGEQRDPLTGAAVLKSSAVNCVLEEGSGAYTAEEFDQAVYDIVNFLYYTGEPSRLERHRTGIFVLLFWSSSSYSRICSGVNIQKDVKH